MNCFRFIPFFCGLALSAAGAENLLTNPYFEENVPYQKERHTVELVNDCDFSMNAGEKYRDISLVQPG